MNLKSYKVSNSNSFSFQTTRMKFKVLMHIRKEQGRSERGDVGGVHPPIFRELVSRIRFITKY